MNKLGCFGRNIIPCLPFIDSSIGRFASGLAMFSTSFVGDSSKSFFIIFYIEKFLSLFTFSS